MALDLTERARRESQKLHVEPQLVLEIEGVTTLFGAVEILRYVQIGDPGLVIGSSWRIGDLIEVEDTVANIQIDSGSGAKIDQQLQPDKGSVSSVSSIQLSLTDKHLVMTRLISPGVTLPEILGVKANVWIGFRNTAWKQDYVRIFSGIIDDVEAGAGNVKLTISHPEQLKRQQLFTPIDVILDGAIDSTQTTIPLVSTEGLLTPVNGPDGSPDDAIDYYVMIDEEIIRYTGISGDNLTGCGRGALTSVNVGHDDEAEGKSLVSIEDSAINIALKIMLSGLNGPYVENLAISRFLHPTAVSTVENSIFFEGVDVFKTYGVTAGDYITITGASEPENNITALQIEEVVSTEDGSYIVISDAGLVEELDTSAVVAIRSQYDTLGEGLALTPDQVDVTEHKFWHEFQLSGVNYRFVIKDTIQGKTFLDEQVYRPIGGYSIPRGGRASMGFHVGPIVRDQIKVLDRTNIKFPEKIRSRRSINRHFYNTIIFKFDKDPVTDKFRGGVISTSAESRNRIRVGNKTLIIEAEGLRRDLDGTGTASRTASRYLGRYQLAAESFEALQLLFRDGFTIEPGDQVLLDSDGLKIANTADGTREKREKVFEVINSKRDLKTGDVTLALVDTNFDLTERYGVISPSSTIVAGSTAHEILIEDSHGEIYPGNESRKWEDYLGLPVLIHSVDWSYQEEVTLLSIDPGNKYKLITTPLTQPPEAGWIVDIANYPSDTDPATSDRYKAVHCFLGPTATIETGNSDTHFDVTHNGIDILNFHVGDICRVHSPDYSRDSGEVEIVEVDTIANEVTVASSLGFTPEVGDVVSAMGFPDETETYRIY